MFLFLRFKYGHFLLQLYVKIDLMVYGCHRPEVKADHLLECWEIFGGQIIPDNVQLWDKHIWLSGSVSHHLLAHILSAFIILTQDAKMAATWRLMWKWKVNVVNLQVNAGSFPLKVRTCKCIYTKSHGVFTLKRTPCVQPSGLNLWFSGIFFHAPPWGRKCFLQIQ